MLNIKRKNNLKVDAILIGAVLIISLLSLLSLYFGNDKSIFAPVLNVFSKQLLFVVLGLIVFFIISHFDSSIFNNKFIIGIAYILTIISLFLVLFLGDVRNNARRWFEIAGFQVQPSEFAKLITILVTIYVMSLEKFSEWMRVILSFLVILPVFILIYIQPSGSIALIVLFLWLITVYMSLGNQLRSIMFILLGVLNVVGLVAFIVFHSLVWIVLPVMSAIILIFSLFSSVEWKFGLLVVYISSLLLGLFIASSSTYIWNNVLKEHHRQRLTTYFQEMTGKGVDSNSNWQVSQSRITIGSGGLTGKGWGKGTQTVRDFLPEHNTDFIFATYTEQTGFIGAIILICLYAVIFFRILYYSFNVRMEPFAAILLTLLLIKFILEIFINLGTNLGIVPPTGIPLPLMSYGGTITLVTFFSLGLIQSIMNSNYFIDNE